ncbi:unnamed protein product [Miscanthus lutarioriparius]|uniref:HIT domain-containing protein n=1 Tax=Miscanthus lutarioriparius TaxID=422564 RepID=A0A811PPE3_9POAL|nr:unnamed protein product [Miscanthus lutarioriparius]
MLRWRAVLLLPLPLPPPPRLLRRLPHPRALSSSSSSPLPPPGMEASYKFGPYKIDAREVFHATPLSYGMVNLRPLLPVAHVHIHLIPRKKGDFEKNDEIFDAIDVKEKELKEKLDLDIERKDRTMDEMAQEANEYRALFS